jgi:hypothetical protein
MADRMQEEHKSKHDERCTALKAQIMKLTERLTEDKNDHSKDETALNSAYDAAD